MKAQSQTQSSINFFINHIFFSSFFIYHICTFSRSYESTESDTVVNSLLLENLQRSDLHSLLTCQVMSYLCLYFNLVFIFYIICSFLNILLFDIYIIVNIYYVFIFIFYFYKHILIRYLYSNLIFMI